MKLSKTAIIIAIILSIALFVTGMNSYSLFFRSTLFRIDGVVYQADSVTQQGGVALIYSLTLAAIPVVTILLWRQANIHSSMQKIVVPVVLIICIAVTTLVRLYWFAAQIKKEAEFTRSFNERTNENITSPVLLDQLNIEKYMLIGLFAGILIVYLIIRKKPSADTGNLIKVEQA